MPKFVRRELPPVFANYRDYKPYLRRDFMKRCCYCGLRDFDGGEALFHIDHFRPKESFPELETVYVNLFYSCAKCNRSKWHTWPDDHELSNGFRFWNPCDDRSASHFVLDRKSGALGYLTNCGRYTIDEIRLDRKALRELRLKRIVRATRFRDAVGIRIEIVKRLESDDIDPIVRRTLEDSLRLAIDVIQEISEDL